jgi:electron transport complex protein RnfB
MNWLSIVTPIIVLGGLGVLFALLLVISSKKFAVEIDPKISAVIDILPGANCGVCGYTGCSGYAEAVVKDTAPVNGCIPGGQKIAEEIARITGKQLEAEVEAKIAVVNCRGGHGQVNLRFRYNGINDCVMANMLAGGPLSCTYGCLGFGTCVRSCPFGAVSMGADGLPKIDYEKCTGCGVCVSACPRGIIQLIPIEAEIQVACNSHDKGKVVRQICKVGCIACKMCERVCEAEAIKVVDNLAVVDYEKCTACMKCVEKCPTRCIIKTPSKVEVQTV